MAGVDIDPIVRGIYDIAENPAIGSNHVNQENCSGPHDVTYSWTSLIAIKRSNQPLPLSLRRPLLETTHQSLVLPQTRR